MIEKSLSAGKVAELLDLSQRSIYRMCEAGQLVCFKVNGSLRVTENSVERYQELAIQNYIEQQEILTDYVSL